MLSDEYVYCTRKGDFLPSLPSSAGGKNRVWITELLEGKQLKPFIRIGNEFYIVKSGNLCMADRKVFDTQFELVVLVGSVASHLFAL